MKRWQDEEAETKAKEADDLENTAEIKDKDFEGGNFAAEVKSSSCNGCASGCDTCRKLKRFSCNGCASGCDTCRNV